MGGENQLPQRGPGVVRAAGGVVYSYNPAGVRVLLLICDRHRAWTLPKGHLKLAETAEAAAVREIAEETGVVCEIEYLLARITYPVHRHGARRDKEVTFFLAHAAHTPPRPSAEEGIVSAAWVTPATALSTLSYPQVRAVVEQALTLF